MSVWSGEHVAKSVKTPPEIKINPNGVDIGVSEVWLIPEDASSILYGKKRETLGKVKLEPDAEGFYNLQRGVYELRVANEISIPLKTVGRLYPRSSLNRLGMVKSETALWEPGYKGFGTQTVFVPIKLFRIHKTELWFQLVIEDSEEPSHSYDGHWQGEKPKDL